MSDDNNVVVETAEEIQKAERSKKLKRRSSIGRFFAGVKSLLGLSTGNYDDDEDEVEEKQVEETEVKTEQVQPEDKMDVEVAEDEDPEVDFAEEDEFLAEGEEVRPDPKLQAIKKMNLPKKEKIALSKQRSEELLEEDIKRVSQDEESSYTDSPKPVRRGGRPKKVARGRKATTKTTKAAKSPARSRSTSPSKSPSRSRSASPAKKTPAKRGGARKTPAKAAAKSPAKSTSTSPSRSRSASPAKKTPARATRKTPAKSPKTPRATRKTPAKAKAETRTPRTVGRKRKAEDPAEGESPAKKTKVTRRKSAPAKKREETKPGVTVTWPNTVLRQSYKGGKTFYSSVTVNGKKFSLGDTIYLISETGDEYIGIIENLYETKTGRNRAELQWYYKHEETNSTAKPVKGEVYQSDHIDANPIESFVLDRTPVVMHEDKIKDLNAYLAKPDHYYYNRFYDHDAKKFHNAKKDK